MLEGGVRSGPLRRVKGHHDSSRRQLLLIQRNAIPGGKDEGHTMVNTRRYEMLLAACVHGSLASPSSSRSYSIVPLQDTRWRGEDYTVQSMCS